MFSLRRFAVSAFSSIALFMGAGVSSSSGQVPGVVKGPAGFTHPGIVHSRGDLNRMRDRVKAAEQPWLRGFEALKAAPQSSLSYKLQGPFKTVGYENGQYEFRRDASASYNLALMWICTGDQRYAEKSLSIIRAWSREMESFDRGDHLTGGMGVQKFAIAAEIFRYTAGAGWTDTDTTQFTTFLERMRPSVDKPNLFLNQGGYAIMGMNAIAVFTDDMALYKKTMMRATVGDHQDPRKDCALSKTIWASGQVVEMGRDQTHPQGGLGALGCIAQTAWIQGKEIAGMDLFDYLDQRLLKGYEYLAAHNLGYDQEYKAEDENGNKGLYQKLSPTDKGKFSPIFELIYQHYRYLKKVPLESLRYCSQVRDYLKPEGFSEDFPGFGTLTFTQPEAKEPVDLKPRPSQPDTVKEPMASARFPAADFSATQGVGREYFTDISGHAELVASNIQQNDYVRYDHFDFSQTPVDTFIASAGSASPAGCKIDIMLDDLNSEPVGTLQVVNTGWWSTFETFSTKLKKPVSGEHTLFLRFYGGNHGYKFQCNLEWFRFGNEAAWVAEQKTATAKSRFPFLIGSRYGAAVKGKATRMDGIPAALIEKGTTLSFPEVDFSSGAVNFSVKLKSGSGKVEIRAGSVDSPPIATVEVPKGDPNEWAVYSAPIRPEQPILKGSQIIFLTFLDLKEPCLLGGIQLDPPDKKIR